MARTNTNVPENVVQLYLSAFEAGSANQPSVWAKEQGYTYMALNWRAKKQGITLPSRTICELDSLIDWSTCTDLIDGHLLGDASIINPKKRTTSVIQTVCKERDYLVWLTQNTSFWNDCDVWDCSYPDKRTGLTYDKHWIKSRASHYLEQQRQRWYPNGKKALPSDCTLTPQGLLRFFLEDGSRIAYGITLSVHDFSEPDIDRIKQLVENLLGMSTNYHTEKGAKVKIYIPANALSTFYTVIGDCPVACFSYKWR